DGRLTGDPLTNPELELVFHLLEALGLAIRNIWLHDQLASNHEMMVNVLHELSNGCIVIGRDLAILHANKIARRYFSRPGRLGHEVGNALVPISTHQQLLAKKYDDPEFRASLDTAMAEGVRRITRLIDQMRFLAKDAVPTMESVPLPQLIEEAYQEAQKYQPVKSAQLRYNVGDQPI